MTDDGRKIDRKRSTSGEYVETYPLELFLDEFDGPDMATAPEIAERIGCSNDTARNKLAELAEQDKVESEKIGQTYVWRLTEENE